ncbi:MAG: glutathione S-transferase family protein [Myxococcota bacterium]
MLTALVLLGIAFAGWWAWENGRRRTHSVPAGYQPGVELPHEAEFELYHNALSLCSMKARVCMAELGIPYASHPIDLIETGSYENIGRAFLAVNPGGTVPVLVHRGHPIHESHEQIRYAALHAPAGSPSLVPEDPALRAEMERWIDRASITEDPLAQGEQSIGNTVPGLTLPLFASMIERVPYRRILEGVLFHFDKRRPFMFLAFKLAGLERMGRLAPARRLIARSRRQAEVHLDALEAQLETTGGPWILGPFFSLADVSWLVVFERLVQVDNLEAFLGGGRRPRCAGYWQRLKQRPSYRQAIAGHPHPTIEYGTRRLREVKDGAPTLQAVLEGGPAAG